jgi:hypothetical protein
MCVNEVILRNCCDWRPHPLPNFQEISSELAHALGDDVVRITCSAIHDNRLGVNHQTIFEGYVFTKRKLVRRGFVPCTGLSVIEDAGEHEDDNGKLYCFELLVQEAAMRTDRSSVICGVDSIKKRELWVNALNEAVGAPTVVLPFLITPAHNISSDIISKQLGQRDSKLMQGTYTSRIISIEEPEHRPSMNSTTVLAEKKPSLRAEAQLLPRRVSTGLKCPRESKEEKQRRRWRRQAKKGSEAFLQSEEEAPKGPDIAGDRSVSGDVVVSSTIARKFSEKRVLENKMFNISVCLPVCRLSLRL